MMKKLLATMGAGLILAVLASCEAPTEPKAYNQGINIIPAPASLVQNEGAFKLGKSTNVFATTPEALEVLPSLVYTTLPLKLRTEPTWEPLRNIINAPTFGDLCHVPLALA